VGRGLECLGVIREHDLYKNIGDIYICADFEIFKVKVPIIFFGIEDFSVYRDRYFSFFFFFLALVYRFQEPIYS
jgi:hypothetical protein